MKTILLVGDPVAHSLSPKLFHLWFKKFGIEGDYKVRQTSAEELPNLVEAVRKGEVTGLNITIPHKQRMTVLVDALTPTATAIGAVNVVYRDKNGVVIGDNTDAAGFIDNLRHSVPAWNPERKNALILGSGGGARAVVYALLQDRIDRVVVAGRDPKKRNTFVKHFNSSRLSTIPWDEKDRCGKIADLAVNATPLGVEPGRTLDFDPGVSKKGAVVYDLLYRREPTPLLKQAFLQGRVPVDGLGMLVFQAIPAFEIWFGVRPVYAEDLANTLRTES